MKERWLTLKGENKRKLYTFKNEGKVALTKGELNVSTKENVCNLIDYSKNLYLENVVLD